MLCLLTLCRLSQCLAQSHQTKPQFMEVGGVACDGNLFQPQSEFQAELVIIIEFGQSGLDLPLASCLAVGDGDDLVQLTVDKRFEISATVLQNLRSGVDVGGKLPRIVVHDGLTMSGARSKAPPAHAILYLIYYTDRSEPLQDAIAAKSC
ncbi:MAG: hypothetical protein JWP89_1624 [Schlesneria sp.]|nr:hypothetical protein [Schlesneria sp.]